ncbi:MAG: LmeA family phospholipid-binding protein [Actinotalea sp.]|nr:LmeA family phospholipid-binding protein [Actinotalea sp.]
MLLVLVVVGLVTFLVMTEPAGTGSVPSAGPTSGSGPDAPSAEPSPSPPTDLTAGEVWLGDVALEAGSLATVDGLLRDVRADGVDVRTGPAGLTAASMVLDATVPFELVAEQIGEGIVVGPAPRGEARVSRSTELLGRRLNVSATGTVTVVDGQLVVEPTAIDVGGPSLLSGVLAALAREAVTIAHEIEGLPEGMVLDDVVVQEDGFRARLVGDDVWLAPGALGVAP